MIPNEVYLRGVEVNPKGVLDWEAFPFNIPAVRGMEGIDFRQPVTILAGENGSGKSTILEGIAELAGMNPTGGSKGMRVDREDDGRAPIAWGMTLRRGPVREMDGFFLRAESYWEVANSIQEYENVEYCPRGFMEANYGGDPHARSHGESFLALVMNRFGPNSLYLLDEPESALSPTRQLSLMLEMERLVGENCQFVLATHSPILMAYPGARLFWLGEEGVEERDFRETDHYAVTRRMLEDPEGYLGRLGIGGQGRLGL